MASSYYYLRWTGSKLIEYREQEDSLRVREPQADSLHSVQPPEVRENSLGKNSDVLEDFWAAMPSIFGKNYLTHKANVNKSLDLYIY